MALSFKDNSGKDIPFESIQELILEKQKDIVTNETTAYLVDYNDGIYSVDKQTYEALAAKGALKK